jgi:hypothetical protein
MLVFVPSVAQRTGQALSRRCWAEEHRQEAREAREAREAKEGKKASQPTREASEAGVRPGRKA